MSGLKRPVVSMLDSYVSEELATSIFHPQEGGSTFLRNVGNYLPEYTLP
jgi:hypothetical protein